MDLPALIAALSRPDAYPHPCPGGVVVHQTHISVVFLAAEYAYKLKKPVDLGFLDFTTLQKRKHFCEEETRLNRRLAADVYLGVVPVTRDGSGLRIEGPGEVVEWAVKMRRLPEEASLGWHVRQGKVEPGAMEVLAGRIAEFHRSADSGPHISASGRFAVVAANARENFEQSRNQVGTTVSPSVFDRLRILTDESLNRLRPLIEARAARGVPRDTHGDLRLDHVYFLPDGLAVIDCVEFNERFRHADPVADVAFLVMDLLFAGRRDLARVLIDAYFRESGDEEGKSLLPFYVAYRATVRGKVEGMKLAETEVPEWDRSAALRSARGHWLLALEQLEEPARRPCLLLVGGLPGTGKTTLARGLASAAGFEVIRSDVVRKELAPGATPEQLYSPAWIERTYSECLRRAERLLFDGNRVIVDAMFREQAQRKAFLALANRMGVPGFLIVCETPAELIRARLAARTDDASDADWAVYQKAAGQWEPLGIGVERRTVRIDTSRMEEALDRAQGELRRHGLL
jgi:aminoglycoside phosphotransferase family enzyme/predicted kinase